METIRVGYFTLPQLRYGRAAILIVLSLLLLAMSSLSFGYSVTVGDYVSAGVVSPDDLNKALACAAAAASEILGENVNLREIIAVKPRLISGGFDRNLLELERALLRNTPGITEAYLVTIDGNIAGRVTDLSELGEASEALLAEYTVPETVYCAFTSEIKARRFFTREDMPVGVMEVMLKIRELASIEVVNIEADESIEAGLIINPAVTD